MTKTMVLSFAFVGTLGMSLVAGDVSSASTMASQGVASPGSDGSCLNRFMGAVLNQCSTTQHWEVTDTAPTAGNHNIQVTAMRPNGGTLTCRACSATKEGFTFGCAGPVPLNVVDIDTQFSVGTVNVPSFGGLVVFCDMSPNAWFDSVDGIFWL